MAELKQIGTTSYGVYSRNNSLPVYADTKQNVVFTGLNFTEATKNVDSKTFTVEVRYASRPDKISYRHYSNPLLGWRICEANGITDPYDPVDGLYAGRQIVIPSKNFAFKQLI
jgi:hypothetical protein